MDRQAIIDNLLDHYENPRHHGEPAVVDVMVRGGNPDCGDLVTIYLKMDASGRYIETYGFEGRGCTISQAAASILGTLVQGAELARVQAMDEAALIDLLGREVVSSRARCATLALGTLKTAIARYRSQKLGAEEPGSLRD